MSSVNRDRLAAFGKRLVAHNRQPGRIAALPFQFVALALAAYALWMDSGSSALLLVAGGIGLFSLVVPGLRGFVEGALAGYHTRVPKAK